MTIEDLREQDVLLPEEEWGRHRLETTVPEWPLAAAFLVAAASLVVAYLGDGGTTTWIGVGVFLVTLYLITWLVDRAVLRQRERFRRERRETGHTGGGEGP
jgi:Flp pilus assembly protein TadB